MRSRASAEILGDIEGLGERDFADEMVRHAGAECRRGFGRQDVEPAVNLERVGADDFASATLRDGDGEVGFSHRRRPGDDEEWAGRVIMAMALNAGTLVPCIHRKQKARCCQRAFWKKFHGRV